MTGKPDWRAAGGIALAAFVSIALMQSPSSAANTHLVDLVLLTRPDPISEKQRDALLVDNDIAMDLILKDPSTWSGTYVDQGRLVVTTTGPLGGAEKALGAQGFAGDVVAREVSRSYKDLQDLTAAVVEYASTNGIDVNTVGPQYRTNRVLVGLARPEDRTRSQLAEAFGDSVAVYEDSGKAEGAASRWVNTDPFRGGAAVMFSSGTTGDYQRCSNAFAWTDSAGSQYLLSASHCVTSTSGTVYPYVRTWSSFNSTQAAGDLVWRSGGSNGTYSNRRGDIAVYELNQGLTASARIYDGQGNTTTTRSVSSVVRYIAEDWTGSNLFTSGASGFYQDPYNGNIGKLDPYWVSLVNQTVEYSNGQTYTSLWVAEHEIDCVIPGDSGGAVFLAQGASASQAVGIISGRKVPSLWYENCRNYFTPLGVVADDFGGWGKTYNP